MNDIMMKSATAIGAAGAFSANSLNVVPMYLFNVPLSVIFMAFVGAALSYAWADEQPALPKKKVYVGVIFYTLMTTSLVAVLPHWLGWEWYDVKYQGSLAFIMAAAARFILPAFTKMLPEIVRKWFKIGEYNSDRKNDNETQ